VKFPSHRLAKSNKAKTISQNVV